MMKNNIATNEEMAFLFPKQMVFETHLKAIRPRILNRCMLILLVFLVRALVVTYYPEHPLPTTVNKSMFGAEAMGTLPLLKQMLWLFCSTIYLYSFYKNAYFRLVNIAALIGFCSLIWRDFQFLLQLEFVSHITFTSIGMIFLRLTVGALLVLNYLDVRDK
mgnify:FL=1|jgi:hypothetical protein|tara:strand:- start:662 stop:1144 length:483 start_codon:yes stop_codon:yes gene_type:complete